MNRLHYWYCRSDLWRRTVHERLLPWVLGDAELSGRTLEIGPGPGLTTEWLAPRCESLTCVEMAPDLAERLRRRFPEVDVRTGDARAMPFDAGTFDTVVCCTMLHHVPTEREQDELLAEVRRVLRPGGRLVGSDSRTSTVFRVAHLRDTCVPIDPATLPSRLRHAGFSDVDVTTVPKAIRFRAA